MRPIVRLIGIDVDGTLVGASGEVRSPHLGGRRTRARDRRPSRAVLGATRFRDGARIRTPTRSRGLAHFPERLEHRASRHGRVPLHCPAPELVANAIRVARRTGDVLELYNDRRYVAESTHRWSIEHAKLLGVSFEARPFESLDPPIVRAQWVVTPARAREIMAGPHDNYEIAQSTSPLMPDARFVGLTPKGINKGSAIRAVASAYGVDLDEVMYVGDAGNDLPALQIVGHPIAMGNADPAVIEAAVCTVGHVDRGGLAQAIGYALTAKPRVQHWPRTASALRSAGLPPFGHSSRLRHHEKNYLTGAFGAVVRCCSRRRVGGDQPAAARRRCCSSSAAYTVPTSVPAYIKKAVEIAFAQRRAEGARRESQAG